MVFQESNDINLTYTKIVFLTELVLYSTQFELKYVLYMHMVTISGHLLNNKLMFKFCIISDHFIETNSKIKRIDIRIK